MIGARIAWTSLRSPSSTGSSTHFAHSATRSGLADPAMQVAMSGFRIENWTASFAMSLPRFAAWSAAFRATSRPSGVALCQEGSGAFESSRALNGAAFITPVPFAFASGIRPSSMVFWSV